MTPSRRPSTTPSSSSTKVQVIVRVRALRSSANSSSTAGVGRPLTQAEEEDEEEDDVYDDYYPVEEEASRRQSVFSSTSFRLNSSSSSICGVSGASAVTSSEQGDYSLVANPYERLIHYFSRSPRAHSASYSFDSVLLGKDNRQLFHNTPIRELIQTHLMAQAQHCTVLAYGQTNSGKTYAMMGTDYQPGILPQAINEVFEFIKRDDPSKEYLLRVSYLEIYNEQLRDLLSPSSSTDLRILEDKKRGIYVSPLKEEIVTSPKQVLKCVQRGEKNRHYGSTEWNFKSSRSHTVFQMVIECRRPARGGGDDGDEEEEEEQVTFAQLNLIDLAGSEKAVLDADRRKEGAYINKSLLTLGNVISKLTEERPFQSSPYTHGSSSAHIPFRDSKLTRLLQTSLSGNSRIAVIATLNPAPTSSSETLSTLKFAARLKKMVLDPVSNQIRGGVWMGGYDDKTLLQMYKVEIEELRMRLVDMENRLKQQQQHAQSGEGSSSPSSTLASITEEISPQQVLDVNALISEKQAYMAKLQDEHLIKVALKERIDHLTKLILTSSTLTSKAAILDWDAPCSDGDSVFGDNEVGGDNASGVNIVVDTFGETVAKTGSVKRKSLRKRASVMTLQGLLLPSMTPSASNEDNKNDGVNTSPNSRIVHTSASSSPSSSTSRIPQSSLSPLRQQIHSMQISSSSQKQQQESEFYRRHIQEIDIRDEKISRLESLVAEISRTCSSTTTTITKTASVSSSSPISNILSLIRSFEESAGTSMDTIFTAHQAEVTRLNTDRAELEIIVKDQEETIVSMTSQIQEMNLMIEWHQQQQMQQQQLQKHNNPLGESATVMLMELDAQQARIRELEALNGGLQGQVVELKNLISSTSSSAATPSLTTPSSSNESSPFSSRPTSPTTTATQAIVSSSPPKRSLKSPGRTSSVRSTTSTTSLASSANLTLNSTTSTSTSGHLRRSSTASSASVRAIDKSLKQNFFDLFGGGSLLVNNNENQPEGDGDGDKRASALLWKG